jgi:hypothetical protein
MIAADEGITDQPDAPHMYVGRNLKADILTYQSSPRTQSCPYLPRINIMETIHKSLWPFSIGCFDIPPTPVCPHSSEAQLKLDRA